MALAWRMFMLMAAAITAITVGCTAAGSTGSSEPTIAVESTAVTRTDAPTVGDVAVAAVDGASTFACEVEYSTIQMAIDTFSALTGAPPTGIEDLVPEYLRAPSDSFDIDPTGTIVILDGPCEDVVP